jgi:branched-chain amino acid transport system substrate-binding protein
VIFVGADGATIGRVADSCARQNFHPLFVTSALAVTNDQAANPLLDGMTIVATVFPWMLGDTPAEQAYLTAMDHYAHGTTLSGASAEAWTSGMLFKAAVERLGAAATRGPVTTAMILQGLAMIRGETLQGLAPPSLNFNAGKPVTPDVCYFVAAIHGRQWTAPYGNKTFCKP